MQVINGKGIAWDNDIDFYTKVIDIDFYNSTNRRLHLGHVNDCNFTLLRLIMPKEYDNYNKYTVVMRFKPNNSEARTFEPKIVVGNVIGEHYFSITGDCTEKTSQGYIQFVVQCINNSNKIVQATSNKIPYIIEETLESGDPSTFTEEEASRLEQLSSNVQTLENNVNQRIGEIDEAIDGIDIQLTTVGNTLTDKADKGATLEDYGITDAYTINDTNELLDSKANYITGVRVNQCTGLGSIYYTTITDDNGESFGAIVISAKDLLTHKIAQLAFTGTGELLYRVRDGANGATWNENDTFKRFGGGS